MVEFNYIDNHGDMYRNQYITAIPDSQYIYVKLEAENKDNWYHHFYDSYEK